MKIGAGLLLWVIIAVVFFRWASEEERANTPRHGLDELDRELTRDGVEEMTDTTTAGRDRRRRRRARTPRARSPSDVDLGGRAARPSDTPLQDAGARSRSSLPLLLDRDRRGRSCSNISRVFLAGDTTPRS